MSTVHLPVFGETVKISPLRSLPERAGLKLTSWQNARILSRVDHLEQQFTSLIPKTSLDVAAGSISATIHPYCGLGHQISGWISAFLWSQDLGLEFAGGSVTRDDGGLFAFPLTIERGRGSSNRVFRLCAVPDERDPRSFNILRGQIERALDRWPADRIDFRLALDQARWDQTPASAAIRAAVLGGSRGSELLAAENAVEPYIAIHVRRGDVGRSTMGGSTGQSRWVDESWYVNVVRDLRKQPELADLEVRAYAIGQPEDFPALAREGISIRLGGDRDEDFIGLAASRVLVAAPSSFSFTAGLTSKSVVVAKIPWWHNVPSRGRWVGTTEKGALDKGAIERALHFAE